MSDLYDICSAAATAPGKIYTYCPKCSLRNVYLGQMDGVNYMLCRSKGCTFIFVLESADELDRMAYREWWKRNADFQTLPIQGSTTLGAIPLRPSDIEEKRS